MVYKVLSDLKIYNFIFLSQNEYAKYTYNTFTTLTGEIRMLETIISTTTGEAFALTNALLLDHQS